MSNYQNLIFIKTFGNRPQIIRENERLIVLRWPAGNYCYREVPFRKEALVDYNENGIIVVEYMAVAVGCFGTIIGRKNKDTGEISYNGSYVNFKPPQNVISKEETA